MFCSSLSCLSSRRSLLWGFFLFFFSPFCLCDFIYPCPVSLFLSPTSLLLTDNVDSALLCLSVERLSFSLCFSLWCSVVFFFLSLSLIPFEPAENVQISFWAILYVRLLYLIWHSGTCWALRQSLTGLQSCLLQESPNVPGKRYLTVCLWFVDGNKPFQLTRISNFVSSMNFCE